MLRFPKSFLAGLLVASVGASAQAAVSTYTGGDVGEGLDLDTTLGFAYAVNGNGPATTVRDAAFTIAEFPNTPGFTHDAGAGYGPLGVNYGATADDDALELTTSGRYNLSTTPINLDFSGLSIGTSYKLQLLFHEPAGALTGRILNVSLEGNLTDSVAFNTYGSLSNNGIGVVVTQIYTAGDTNLDVTLQLASGSPDNPFFSAATLEILPIPEPGAIMAIGISAMLSLGRWRRAR